MKFFALAMGLFSSLSFGASKEADFPFLPFGSLPLPLVRQQTGYSCGPAAMLSILKYWQGFEGNERDLYDIFKTSEEEGTHPLNLVAGARQFGLFAQFLEGMTLDQVRAYLKDGYTVILDIQAWTEEGTNPDNVDWENRWDDGHYVVLVGMDRKYSYFMDPSMDGGKYGYIPNEELLRRWHDWEEEDGKRHDYYHEGIIFKGNKPFLTEVPTTNLGRIK